MSDILHSGEKPRRLGKEQTMAAVFFPKLVSSICEKLAAQRDKAVGFGAGWFGACPQALLLVLRAARAGNWSDSSQFFRARCFPKKRGGEPVGYSASLRELTPETQGTVGRLVGSPPGTPRCWGSGAGSCCCSRTRRSSTCGWSGSSCCTQTGAHQPTELQREKNVNTLVMFTTKCCTQTGAHQPTELHREKTQTTALGNSRRDRIIITSTHLFLPTPLTLTRAVTTDVLSRTTIQVEALNQHLVNSTESLELFHRVMVRNAAFVMVAVHRVTIAFQETIPTSYPGTDFQKPDYSQLNYSIYEYHVDSPPKRPHCNVQS